MKIKNSTVKKAEQSNSEPEFFFIRTSKKKPACFSYKKRLLEHTRFMNTSCDVFQQSELIPEEALRREEQKLDSLKNSM